MKDLEKSSALEESRRIMQILIDFRNSSSSGVDAKLYDRLEAEWYQIRMLEKEESAREVKLRAWMKKVSVRIIDHRNKALASSYSESLGYSLAESLSEVNFFSSQWQWPWPEQSSRRSIPKSKMAKYAAFGAAGVFATLALMEDG